MHEATCDLKEVNVGVIGVGKEAMPINYQPLDFTQPLGREAMDTPPLSGHGRPVMARVCRRAGVREAAGIWRASTAVSARLRHTPSPGSASAETAADRDDHFRP